MTFFKARTPFCGHLRIIEGVFFLYAAKSFGFSHLKDLTGMGDFLVY